MEAKFKVYKNPNIDTSKVASRYKRDNPLFQNSDPTLNNVVQMQQNEKPTEQEKEVSSTPYLVEKLLPDVVTNSDTYQAIHRGYNTVADVGLDLAKGILKFFEGIGDFLGTGVAAAGDELGADTTGLRELIKKDLSEKIMNSKLMTFSGDPIGTIAGKYKDKSINQAIKEASYLNEASEGVQEGVHGVAQSIGEMLPSIAFGRWLGVGAEDGAGRVAPKVAEWLQLGSFGLGAAGNASEEALNEGATSGQALGYGALSGATEMLTEKLFDGLNLFGGGVADRFLAKAGKPVKVVANLLGEGVEEVLSDLASPAWKQIVGMADTYQENAPSIADLAESFALGSVTSMIMGGAGVVSSMAEYSKNGAKLISLNKDVSEINDVLKNEVDKVIKDRVTKEQWKELQNDSQAYNNLFAEVIDELNALKRGNNGVLPRLYRNIQSLINAKNKIIIKMNNLLNNMSEEKIKKVGQIKLRTTTNEKGEKVDYTLGKDILANTIDISDINNHNVTLDKGVRVVGKGTISNDKITLDKASAQNLTNSQKVQANRIVRAINTINSKFGTKYDVVFTDGLIGKDSEGKDVNLHGNKINGTFYININSQKALLKTTMHELTHTLENTTMYDELLKFTKDTLGEERFRKIMEVKRPGYERLGQGDDTILEREVVADAFGNIFDTYEDVKKLVNANESLAKKIKNWIARKFNQSKGDTALRKELKPAYEMLNKALGEKNPHKSEQNVSNLDGFTYTTDTGFQFSAATFNEEKLTENLKNRNYSTSEINEVIEQQKSLLETELDFVKKTGYSTLEDFINKEAVFSLRNDGGVVMSILVANGDYVINFDLSATCKKKVAYQDIIETFARAGIFDNRSLSPEDIAKVHEILRNHGVETPCTICFVESRRMYQFDWARKAVKMWNDAVREILGEKATTQTYGFGEAKQLTSELASEVEKVYGVLDSKNLKKNAQGNYIAKSEGSEERVKTIVQRLYDGGMTLKFMTPADIITSSGLVQVKQFSPEFFSFLKSSYGAGTPKMNLGFTPYLNEVLDLDNNLTKKQIGKSIKGLSTLENSVKKAHPKWSKTQVKDEALRKLLYAIGGARYQSFSDFRIEQVFDARQFFDDLAIRKLPAHIYTKEYGLISLFGLTGAKLNMSLISQFNEETNTKEYGKYVAGLREVTNNNSVTKGVNGEELSITLKVDESGNPIIKDGHIVEAKQGEPNTKTYTTDFITSADIKNGAINKNFRDSKNRPLQSFPYDKVLSVLADEQMSKNCGPIAIGFSEAHTLLLLRSKTISQVIPYHASGMVKTFSHLYQFNNVEDYTQYQEEKVVVTSNNAPSSASNLIKNFSFNFNERLQKNSNASNPVEKTIQEYKDYCYKERTATVKGVKVSYHFAPKFESFINEDNYYKLLADFSLFDVNGNYCPQQAVTHTYPDNFNELVTKQLGQAYETDKSYQTERPTIMKEVAEALGVKNPLDKATSNPLNNKIRYSVETDSDGNPLTVEQAEFFKNSKARDEEGNLLNLYHGTTFGGFMEFSNNSPIFLSDNYEGASGYGLSNNPVITRTFKNINDLINYLYDEGNEELHLSEKGIDFMPIKENEDAAKYREEKIAAYKENGIKQDSILLKNLENAEYVLSLSDGYGDFDYFFYTEKQALESLISDIQTQLSFNANMNMDEDITEDENTNSVYQVYANVENPLRINCRGNNFLNIQYQGKRMTTDEIAEQVKNEGKYDGIIFENIVDNGERDFFNEAGLSNVYVAFNPNQVKAIDNYNPSSNNDIRYSVSDVATNDTTETVNAEATRTRERGIEDTRDIPSNYVRGRANYLNDAVYQKKAASKLFDNTLSAIFKEKNPKISGGKDKIINYIFQELNKTKLEDITSGSATDSMANKIADYIITHIDKKVTAADKATLVSDLAASIQEAYLNEGKIAGYKAMKEKLLTKIAELKKQLYWNRRLVVETRKMSRAIDTFKKTTNRNYSNNPSAKPLDKMFTQAVDILKKLRLTNFYTQEARNIMKEYRDVFYNKDNEMLKDDYSQMIVDMIDSIVDGSGNLDVYEMNTLVNIYQSLNKLMKYYDNVVFEDRVEKATEIATNLQNDIASGRKINKNISSTAFNTIQKPRLVLRQFDGSSGDTDNSLTNLVYGELRQAEDKFKKNYTSFQEKLLDFEKKHKKFKKRLFKQTVEINGKKIPLGEAITIYQWSRREQARKHFMKDVNPSAQGINIYSQKNGNFLGTFVLTQEDIDKLHDSFDNETLEYINFIDGLIEDAKVLKEETDYKALGFTNAVEDFYFPIMTDSMYNAYKNFGDVRNVQAIDSVLGLSMNKNVVTNANNKLRLQNAYDIVNRHINQASKYNAYYVTIKAIQKSMNTYTENKTTAKQSLIEANPEIIDYIDNLIIDVADVRQPEIKFGERISSFLRGNLAIANLGLNLKVIFNQLSSIPTALSILSPRSLIKSYKMGIGKNAASDMDKYCRYTYYRHFNNTKVMSEIYRSDSNTIIDEGFSTVREGYHKVQNLVMQPISRMDRRAMVRLWNACQVEVESKYGLKIGTEENKVKAGELLEKVIRETQPDYSPLESPQIKKSRSELVRWMTMFTTQPLQNLNQIIEASNDIRNIREQIKKNGASDELNAKLSLAKKKLARNAASVMAANLMYTLIALGFKELLGKRKEDEGIAEEFIKDFMGTNVGMIPIVREIYNKLFNNYDLSADPLGAVNDFIDATKAIYNNVNSGNYQGLWYKLSKALSTLTGIPFKNINEYSMAIIGAFSPSTAYKYRSIWYNKTVSEFTNDLEKAITKKDDSQINAIIQALYSKKGITLDNSVVKELNKLSRASTKPLITLKSVTSSTVINGEQVEINDTSKVKKYYSENVNASLNSLIKNAYYAGLTKEEKAYAIKLSNDAAFYKALTKVLKTDIKENKINLLTKAFSGNTYYTMIAALAKCKNSLKGDKVKIQKYINSLRLSKQQKYILYGLAGYKPLNENAATQVSNYLTIKGYDKEMREYIMDFAKLI